MVETALIENILSYSIGGVSLGMVVALTIYVIRYIVKTKRENNMTKETIMECFKEVVLPKDLRINLSKNIVPAIKEQIKESMKPVTDYYEKLIVEVQLMLSILSKFTHAEDLTEEEKEKLKELLNDPSIYEVEISE